jgi:hypothetical protein
MGQHTLPGGARLIQGIKDLGRVLGYHVSTEFPVPGEPGTATQAVDVAWFDDEVQRYPLMIFEVESRATNTIANNPLKVFAQDTRQFEKPLFFFQVIVGGTQSTNRIAQLERQYGTYNYRLYRLAHDEGTALVKDVITQHRRIAREIDYVALYDLLQSAEWSGLVDGLAALDHARDLGLSPDRVLASSLRLARKYDPVARRLPAVIEQERMSGWIGTRTLSNWWGSAWGPMVLSAWMCGRAATQREAAAWDEHLNHWQNEASFMPMFHGDLPLSNENTIFMLSAGGPFAALVVAVARARGATGPQLCKVLIDALKCLRADWHGLQLAAWALHLSARLALDAEYETARTYIDTAGGLSLEDLITPPSVISAENSRRDEWLRAWDGAPCPSQDEFVILARRAHAGPAIDREALMLRVLDEEHYHLTWNTAVLTALWDMSDSAAPVYEGR